MTTTIQELFSKKEQLMQQISLLDGLIKIELDNDENVDASVSQAREEESTFSKTPDGDGTPAVLKEPANPAYDRLNWRKKIMHHLRHAEGRGMSTADLNKALQSAHHGEWSKPSIGTTLFLMERDGLVRVDRGQGRNLHYAPDAPTASQATQIGNPEQ